VNILSYIAYPFSWVRQDNNVFFTQNNREQNSEGRNVAEGSRKSERIDSMAEDDMW
jgi:hypothetical protein